jgi:[acyl-carrier-protein] S-malonyltransferase
MKAFVFPGQGAQFSGMGKDLYDFSTLAKERFAQANEILGFRISDTMFNGSIEDLKQTKVTQPAVFLHSVILAELLKDSVSPDMVSGHSLGEFSALVVAGGITFEDGLKLVSARANAMQSACDVTPSTMAAVIGLENHVVEEICKNTDGNVVAANYNCPGQIVISGEVTAVESACETLKEAGARRALLLPVGGAFHSTFMEPAREKLAEAIEETTISELRCPIFQNVSASAETDVSMIRKNLVAQLTAPVKWTQSMEAMLEYGASSVTEIGPGNVLQGLFKKLDRSFPTSSAEITS